MKPAFLSPLRVELVDPHYQDGTGLWRLVEPFLYRSGVLHRSITVPAGYLHDFASVPRLPFAYANFGNRYHRPAVVHDWLCEQTDLARGRADRVFAEAMRLQNEEEIAAMRAAGIDDDEVVDRRAALEGRCQLMHAAVVAFTKSGAWRGRG